MPRHAPPALSDGILQGVDRISSAGPTLTGLLPAPRSVLYDRVAPPGRMPAARSGWAAPLAALDMPLEVQGTA
jgi:hypothetical protein